MYSFNQIVEKLKQNQVVAYPTEAVFGLGCNPQSEQAVRSLLKLKNRPEEKGLILIKKSRVENEFAEKNLKIKTVDLKQIISDRQSYACGEKSADDVNLLVPLENKTTENIILIN